MVPIEIATDRLILRRWKASDREPFAALNADPTVMRYLPAPYSTERSNATIDRMEASFDERGYGWFAIERRDTGDFIGTTGLNWADFDVPFLPAAEIGWRFAADVWGHGFATEAASAALWFGFERCGLAEIVSFTAVGNRPSQRVMQRIGMVRDRSADFDHPKLESGHELERHVVYRAAPDAVTPARRTTG